MHGLFSKQTYNEAARMPPYKDLGNRARADFAENLSGAARYLVGALNSETTAAPAREATAPASDTETATPGTFLDVRVPTFLAAAAPAAPAVAPGDAEVAPETAAPPADETDVAPEYTEDAQAENLVSITNAWRRKEQALYKEVCVLRELKKQRDQLDDAISNLEEQLEGVTTDIEEQTRRIARRASSLEKASDKSQSE